MTGFELAALVVAVVALLVAALAFLNVKRVRDAVRRSGRPLPASDPNNIRGPAGARAARTPSPVQQARMDRLAQRVEALEELGLTWQQSLRHVAVVRYDAFGDVAGSQSWSLAILDDAGDGVVVTAINGRDAARTYAKNVRAGQSDAALSPEELEAIGFARADGADGAESPDQPD